jgi:OFA family oxalate/formate antiporter-like MFS transporter
MFCSALYLAPPPRDWLPAGFKIKLLTKKVRLNKDLAQLRANEAIKTPRFYYLWLMLFINVTCGLALISVAKFMARDVIHLDAEWAAIMVALMSVFNGLGRIGWATLSDYITRPITYIAFFVLQIIAFSLLTEVRNPAFFQILAYIIFACYGGGFAVLPAYIADVFGTKEVSAIHGYLLTAWAAAGLVGPSIIAGLRMLTGSYIDSLYVFVGFLIVALVISLMAKVNISRLKRQQSCT